MARKLARDELRAELEAIRAMLASVPASDPVGRLSFSSRARQLEEELADLDSAPDTTAEVALVFNDGPVYGSRAIDASFAGQILDAYQTLVAKRRAVSEPGGLGRRGPVPSLDSSRLLVTDLVRGSFGFLLREARADEPGFVPSPLREAVSEVTSLLTNVAQQSDEQFQRSLEEMDARVFGSLRNFVEILHEHDASLRLVESAQEFKFDHTAVRRAHERVTQISLDQVEYSRPLQLLGLIPVGRRFEAVDIETNEFISGKVGPSFSQDYLERVNRGEIEITGKRWRGSLQRKTARRSDGREAVTTTLLDLQPLE